MNDVIVDALCGSVDAMVEQSREDAWEELEKENSLREAAHDVTMRVAADDPQRRLFGGECRYWCRYCGVLWAFADKAQSVDPLNHADACLWRIAKLYAEDVGADAAPQD